MSKQPSVELKALIDKETCGISTRSIMIVLAEGDIVIQGAMLTSNLKLIEQLITGNPQVRESLNSIRNSETILERVLSYIPFIGKPTKSEAYLEKHSDLIATIEELRAQGILKASTQYFTTGPVGGRLGQCFSSTIFFTSIELTDFGHKLLQEK